MTNVPRLRCHARRNPSMPDGLLLILMDPCPFCGRLHEHGAGAPAIEADGTYGSRVAHCPEHTEHDDDEPGVPLTARMRARRIPTCDLSHTYVLIPEENR